MGLKTFSATGHFYNLEIKKNRMGGGLAVSKKRCWGSWRPEGWMNRNEFAKAERHARKRGMDVGTYLAHKHGEKAAERGRKNDLAQYMAIHQARRRMLYGEGGKCKADRCGDRSDSSDDSDC